MVVYSKSDVRSFLRSVSLLTSSSAIFGPDMQGSDQLFFQKRIRSILETYKDTRPVSHLQTFTIIHKSSNSNCISGDIHLLS